MGMKSVSDPHERTEIRVIGEQNTQENISTRNRNI
jgi:hypothetical protein